MPNANLASMAPLKEKNIYQQAMRSPNRGQKKKYNIPKMFRETERVAPKEFKKAIEYGRRAKRLSRGGGY